MESYLHAQDNKKVQVSNPPKLLIDIFGQESEGSVSGCFNFVVFRKAWVIVIFWVSNSDGVGVLVLFFLLLLLQRHC